MQNNCIILEGFTGSTGFVHQKSFKDFLPKKMARESGSGFPLSLLANTKQAASNWVKSSRTQDCHWWQGIGNLTHTPHIKRNSGQWLQFEICCLWVRMLCSSLLTFPFPRQSFVLNNDLQFQTAVRDGCSLVSFLYFPAKFFCSICEMIIISFSKIHCLKILNDYICQLKLTHYCCLCNFGTQF